MLEEKNREKIDEVSSSGKGFKPKGFGKGGMDEKGRACFGDVTNFPFRNTILLRSVGTRDAIRDAMSVEIFSKNIFDEFRCSITLNSFDSSREKIFSVGFKVLKMRKSFGFCG